ncbi:MAG: hypothetical protein HDS08_06200 [Bacteroides sp.]|nr:hypothetical protein [Bacteroides sp.]
MSHSPTYRPLLYHLLNGAILAWLMLSCTHSKPAPTVEYPVTGVDISAHNGDIDFDAMSREGVEFVLIKATEGVSHKDANFHTNYLKARRAGMKIGAYHFFRFDCTGYMQALNILHSIRGKHLDLPVVIDVEEWTNSVTQPTEGVVDGLRRMITCLEEHGYRVMLYSNKNGYERFIRSRLESYPVWLCSFSPPDDTHRWVIWQYSHQGRLEGTRGPIDLNAFRGTREEWEKWASGARHAQ